MESIIGKYERYYPDHQVRKASNDILGRAFVTHMKMEE